MKVHRPHIDSFRDLSGFVFRGADGQIYRQVNRCFEAEYRLLMDSGLYGDLVHHGLLIEHAEVALAYRMTPEASTVIRPRPIPFISYPYEWGFSQLRDAALHTLAVQRHALKFGLTLRDGSAFNVQFDGATPVFIDTLSFQKMRDPDAWPGYRQFCRHFVATLGLMSLIDVRMIGLFRTHIDGIPLDLAAQLLPWSTRVGGRLRRHIHQQVKATGDEPDRDRRRERPPAAGSASLSSQQALLDDLEETIRGIEAPTGASPAPAGGDGMHLGNEAKDVVSTFLTSLRPASVWDLNAATSAFADIAASLNARVVAFVHDHACVESLYQAWRAKPGSPVLPLLVDWTNPSPAAGWANVERSSLFDRGIADVALVFGLFEWFTIVRDVPMVQVAEFLNRICAHLIIEFPGPRDPAIERLFEAKGCHNEAYTRQHFEEAFARNFAILECRSLAGGSRYVYLMEATG